MKKYILIFLEMIGMQILAAIFSMLFFIDVIPVKLFSFFTAWLLVWALHSTFWQLGNKDRKNLIIHNNHADDADKKKHNMLTGALVALPFLLFNILMIFATYIFNTDLLVTIQNFIMFSFIGYLSNVKDVLDKDYIITRLIVCLIMYIPCVTAYISGALGFSVVEKYFPKLIYKNK